MGAWGSGAFQNDSAMDWLVRLEAEGVTELQRTLRDVAETGVDRYLDVDDGCAAVAAAALVAAALSAEPTKLPAKATAWIEAHRPSIVAHAALARRAVERVMAAPSELASLWEGNEKWTANVRLLLERLA